jgi:hypothetical protein
MRASAPRPSSAVASPHRAKPKRIAIICQLDAFANGIRPPQIKRFLEDRGHHVVLVDTYWLSRRSPRAGSVGSKLPGRRPAAVALYLIEAASRLLTRRWQFGRHHLSYYMIMADHRLRRAILSASLPLDEFDFVICETFNDAGVLARGSHARTMYDCPAPYADELLFEGRLTDRQYATMRRVETALFEDVDYLAFHWESYARYARDKGLISGHNLVRLDFGCTPAAERASYADPPRVVYLGNITARFNNPSLLARLAALYPHIDVYGGPPPDPKLGLNYLGYAASLDVLRNYQAGLVTCSTDDLRRYGFSSKHIQYLSYGLPVLVPAWRRYIELLKGSIAYDEQSFLSAVESLRDEGRWRAVSDNAYAQAQELRWDITLRPLGDLVASVADERRA